MALSCDSGCDDPSSYAWMWDAPQDFSLTPSGRRKRCQSCKELILCETTGMAIPRWRFPRTDIECNIYGEDGEVPMAPYWMCEECGGLFLSLLEYGYSLSIQDDMRELVKQHANLVRVVGDAPCSKRLLNHDLSLFEKREWSRPVRVAFTQEWVIRDRQQFKNYRQQRTVKRIVCELSSLATLEAQWKMLQQIHPLGEDTEWRIQILYCAEIGVEVMRDCYINGKLKIGANEPVSEASH